jgi:hypothetical protein
MTPIHRLEVLPDISSDENTVESIVGVGKCISERFGMAI